MDLSSCSFSHFVISADCVNMAMSCHLVLRLKGFPDNNAGQL